MEHTEEHAASSPLRQHAEALEADQTPAEGEAEAEAVARVVAAGSGPLARSPLAHPTSSGLRADALADLQQTHGNSYVQQMVQPAQGEGAAIAEIQRRADPGQPLEAHTQAEMRDYMGGGVDHVRVHTDGEAGRMADELNAEAFTVGRDVFFGDGRYAPTTTAGKNLLAHELTHVGQQVGFTPQVQRQVDEEEMKRPAAPPPTTTRVDEEEPA